MASLTATLQIANAEKHIRSNDAHAGIAILEQVKQTFQQANAPKARRAENRSAQQIKALSCDPRAALNVGPCATRKEIKKNYRKLALKYHPDKNQFTEDLFKVIQIAYDQIKDQPTPSKPPASTRYTSHKTKPATSSSSSSSSSSYTRNQRHQQYQRHAEPAKPQPTKPKTNRSHRSQHHHGGAHRHQHRHHRPAASDYTSSNNKENHYSNKTNHRQTKPSSRRGHHYDNNTKTAAAEKEMKDFWKDGGKKFPFKFCRENPEAAAAMFAKMFRGGTIPTTSADATYEAFRAAFEKRGYGKHHQGAGGTSAADAAAAEAAASYLPVENVRALHGQIKQDSIALMWNSSENVICYELKYKRTRDRDWKTSSDSLRTSACRKNNLLAGTHYDFCVRAKYGPTGSWGPVSKTCTVRTTSASPDICVMNDVMDCCDDAVRNLIFFFFKFFVFEIFLFFLLQSKYL